LKSPTCEKEDSCKDHCFKKKLCYRDNVKAKVKKLSVNDFNTIEMRQNRLPKQAKKNNAMKSPHTVLEELSNEGFDCVIVFVVS
jgi:hypothetical protein